MPPSALSITKTALPPAAMRRRARPQWRHSPRAGGESELSVARKYSLTPRPAGSRDGPGLGHDAAGRFARHDRVNGRALPRLEAKGTELYAGTARLIATKEPPSSANQPGHRISPSCIGLRLVPRLRTRCDAHHKKALCSRNALVGSVSVGNPPAGFSRARSPRTCRSCRRQSSSWSSTPRPPECLASLFRRRCSRPPTR